MFIATFILLRLDVFIATGLLTKFLMVKPSPTSYVQAFEDPSQQLAQNPSSQVKPQRLRSVSETTVSFETKKFNFQNQQDATGL